MSFQKLVDAAQKYFPSLQIKYKNTSLLMKIVGTILFFNKDFTDNYTTTLGSTVYFANESYTRLRPISAAVVLLHELVHIEDAKKFTPFLFVTLYLMPQLLSIFCLPLLFVLSWKLVVPICLLLAAPLPAYFRMIFEKRAYLSSLYVLHRIGKKFHFEPHLKTQAIYFNNQFKNSFYYFMWPLGIKKDLNEALIKIEAGNRPFQDPIFDVLDNLIDQY
jgi:hypothetical protein